VFTKKVNVAAGEIARLDAKLEVAAQSSEILVTAARPKGRSARWPGRRSARPSRNQRGANRTANGSSFSRIPLLTLCFHGLQGAARTSIEQVALGVAFAWASPSRPNRAGGRWA
jgi:hypothetical protein